MFSDIDFSQLKLPIEPQNLIYIYLAYKLINNLDKLNLKEFSRTPKVKPASNNFLGLVIIIIGSSFIFLNNILNRISFSSINVENLSAVDPKYRKYNNNSTRRNCPMRKCPLFGELEIEEYINKKLDDKMNEKSEEKKSTTSE